MVAEPAYKKSRRLQVIIMLMRKILFYCLVNGRRWVKKIWETTFNLKTCLKFNKITNSAVMAVEEAQKELVMQDISVWDVEQIPTLVQEGT